MDPEKKQKLVEGYRKRLLIPVDTPTVLNLNTINGTHIAKGYTRIVIGERGPYIEFEDSHMVAENMFIPDDQKWRLQSSAAYYNEWRSVDAANVKIYHQKKVVDYADYKVGMWYISPFELTSKEFPILVEEKNPVRVSKLCV